MNYGILHIPTGNLVHIALFPTRSKNSFKKELELWEYNSALTTYNDEYYDSYSLEASYGFFLSREDFIKSAAPITNSYPIACKNKYRLKRIMGITNFLNQLGMDIHNIQNPEIYGEHIKNGSIKLPEESEFEIVVIDGSIQTLESIYKTLTFSEEVA